MSTRLAPAEYLDAIRREADRLADAALAAGPAAPVPSCPKWDVAALLEHLGRVHRWAAANASRPPDAEPWWSRDVDVEMPDDHRERVAWLRDGASALVAALDRPPDTPAWGFMSDRTVGFWQRRQAQETAMHRWDAQLAAGAPEPIDARLAADGIDEVLEMIPARPGVQSPTGGGEVVHLHCTDVEGEWLVHLDETGMTTEVGHGKGDVAARATASDLLLLLWSRRDLDAVEVLGDGNVLARFQADIRI